MSCIFRGRTVNGTEHWTEGKQKLSPQQYAVGFWGLCSVWAIQKNVYRNMKQIT